MLLIDAGNTRIKWQFRNKKPRLCGSAGSIEELKLQIEGVIGDGERVVAASVRGVEFDEMLVEMLKREIGVDVLLLESTAIGYGLTSAYQDPKALGVDRWLAMIGAISRYPNSSLIIVDAGTALTIDNVDERGLHKGGLITPGYTVLVQSLIKDTGLIEVKETSLPLVKGLANNTADAVTEGCATMLAAFVDSVADEYSNAKLVCTGGGFSVIESKVNSPKIFLKDLVFDGMERVSFGQIKK